MKIPAGQMADGDQCGQIGSLVFGEQMSRGVMQLAGVAVGIAEAVVEVPVFAGRPDAGLRDPEQAFIERLDFLDENLAPFALFLERPSTFRNRNNATRMQRRRAKPHKGPSG